MLGWSRQLFSLTAILLVSEAAGKINLAKSIAGAVTLNATMRAKHDRILEKASRFRTRKHHDPGIDKYCEDLLKIILASPCKKDCFVTNMERVKLHEKLVFHLTKLVPVTQEHKIKNTDTNYKLVINILMRKIEEHKQVNREIFTMAAVKSVYTRSGEWPDILDIYPDLKASTFKASTPKKMPKHDHSYDYQSARDPTVLQYRVAEPENQIDYWREENELHMYHFAWHLQSRDHYPRNRHGERFFYMHRQMLFRYYTERHVLGIPEVVPMSRQQQSRTFVSKYNVEANNEDRDTLQNFVSSREQCSLGPEAVGLLNGLEDEIDSHVSRARSLDDYSNRLSGRYHGQGHNSISRACSSSASNQHVMIAFQTSARDPLFYRWHTEVDLKVVNYLRLRPYNRNEISPAQGVQVSEVEVHDAECGKVQQIQTFWNEVQVKGQTFYGIDHDEFKLIIKLKNSERSRKRVIIRVLLGLEDNIGTGKWYMSIDKFAHQLNGQPDETIDRSEKQSTYTYSGVPYDENSCGWSQRLLIPRGNGNFRFVVFVHDLENQLVNEGMTPETSNVMCGVKSSSIVTDPREYGFPFGRAWQGYNIGTVLRNQDNAFGNVSTPIEISFQGQRPGGRRCEPTDNTDTRTSPSSQGFEEESTTSLSSQGFEEESTTSPSSQGFEEESTTSLNSQGFEEDLTTSPSSQGFEEESTTSLNGSTQNDDELEPEACYLGTCYRTSAHAVSWNKADSLCKRNGLELADINVAKDSFHAMIKNEINKRRNRWMLFWTRNKRPGSKHPGHQYCQAILREVLIPSNCNTDRKRVVAKSGRSFEFIFRAVCQKI